MSEENKTPLLEVKDLKKWFPEKEEYYFLRIVLHCPNHGKESLVT